MAHTSNHSPTVRSTAAGHVCRRPAPAFTSSPIDREGRSGNADSDAFAP